MDGHSEFENSLSLLQWLAGWVVILGTCILFWLAVYRWAVEWRAGYQASPPRNPAVLVR